MFKKILVFLIIFLPLLAICLRLFEDGSVQQTNIQTQKTEFQPVYPSRAPATIPQTKLRFLLEHPRVSAQGILEAEVFMDAYENSVTEVTLEIGYDPKAFQVLTVKPVDFLGGKKITVNTIDKTNGRIIFGARVDSTQTPPLSGSDALIEVELKPINPNVVASELRFLPGTYIKGQGINKNALVVAENKQIPLQ